MCTADKAEGPAYHGFIKRILWPRLFFDVDGKAYVAQSYSKISVTEVNDSLVPVGPDSLVFTGDPEGREGTHVYKIYGLLFVFNLLGKGRYAGCASFKEYLRTLWRKSAYVRYHKGYQLWPTKWEGMVIAVSKQVILLSARPIMFFSSEMCLVWHNPWRGKVYFLQYFQVYFVQLLLHTQISIFKLIGHSLLLHK